LNDAAGYVQVYFSSPQVGWQKGSGCTWTLES
jgi:hypothetical protein